MTTSSNKPLLWILALAGAGLLAVAGWSFWTTTPSPGLASLIESANSGQADDAAYRIAAHGRLSLARDAVPATGPLRLVLDLPDAVRGSGERSARIVSAKGQRIDTTARVLAGPASGVSIEIDPRTLTRGLYMIEVDTLEDHPLKLRRFVLELR